MKRILLLAAFVAVTVGAVIPPDPRWQEAHGDVRVLAIRATWGPQPEDAGNLSGAAAFYDRASFGKLRLHIDLTPWLQAFAGPVCPSGPSSRSAFGPLGESAQDAATAAGYDLTSYARIAYFLPDETCNAVGTGVGREVFLTTSGGVLDDQVFVHELGHTFGLPHAKGSSCVRGCRIEEYGDPYSPMGGGALDFTALEKLKLGWISSVRRVDRSRTYTVADIDVPVSSPQALVVPTAAGEYWIEHRSTEPRRLYIRVVRPDNAAHPQYLFSIFLDHAQDRYIARGVFSLTSGFRFAWLDRKRPTRPRVRALDHAYLAWSRSSDAGSGLAAYRVTVDGKLLATTTLTGAALPLLPHGRHRVSVVAVDRAGNRSRPGTVSLAVS
jgi:hypothetical protein